MTSFVVVGDSQAEGLLLPSALPALLGDRLVGSHDHRGWSSRRLLDDGAIEVTYFQYDGQDSMFQAYEGFRLVSQIEPESGDCQDPASWPAENGYNIGGQPAGRWLCTEALGQTTIYWTDDRLEILSQATHTTSDYARLVQFWIEESGPNL